MCRLSRNSGIALPLFVVQIISYYYYYYRHHRRQPPTHAASTTQKSEDFTYIAAEAWNLASFLRSRPALYIPLMNQILIGRKHFFNYFPFSKFCTLSSFHLPLFWASPLKYTLIFGVGQSNAFPSLMSLVYQIVRSCYCCHYCYHHHHHHHFYHEFYFTSGFVCCFWSTPLP